MDVNVKTPLWLIALSTLAPAVHGADLMQLYRAAQDNDPTFSAARATLLAGQEKVVQGRAYLLPTLNASGNTTWNENEIGPHGKPATYHPQYNSNTYQLTLTQPIFRWQNWVAYDQSRLQSAQAEAAFAQARQELILRVAQAYFDVLTNEENVAALSASKEAIAQQLLLAKKSFEVGTATITDTHEAQSRYDLAVAREIQAKSELEIKQSALQAIIGRAAGALSTWRADAELAAPKPAAMSEWVTAGETNSLPVQIQTFNAEIADREVGKQSAGYLPSIDLVANRGMTKTTTLVSGRPGNLETDFNNVGLQINIPLFTGGMTTSKLREAQANRSAAEATLEATRRNGALAAREAYLGVTNGLAQIHALRAALVSSQSALKSNRMGYEVGVRINIDVLNAENQVYQTRRDLAKATADTVMAQLKLKAAVGTLDEADVAQVNTLLAPNTTQQAAAAPVSPEPLVFPR